MTAYARRGFIHRIAMIGEATAMLGRDAAAMMPAGGGPARGDQLAVFAGLSHGLLIATEAADDLAAAERQASIPIRGAPPVCI